MLWVEQAGIGLRRTTCAVRDRNAARGICKSLISAERTLARGRRSFFEAQKNWFEYGGPMAERGSQWLVGEFTLLGFHFQNWMALVLALLAMSILYFWISESYGKAD